MTQICIASARCPGCKYRDLFGTNDGVFVGRGKKQVCFGDKATLGVGSSGITGIVESSVSGSGTAGKTSALFSFHNICFCIRVASPAILLPAIGSLSRRELGKYEMWPYRWPTV